MKVLIAPDKFKGTLTALEVAQAVEAGWAQVRPQDEFLLTPMADGGTGTVDVVGSVVEDAELVTESVLDALGRPCRATWVYLPDGRALVEAAAATGVDMLRKDELNPGIASSYGTGQLIAAAVQAGSSQVLVGLGGTANVDGGTGMAVALGHRFLAADGSPVMQGARGMADIVRVELASPLQSDVIIVSDVTNPLLGPDGAAAVYGPQKGARPEDIPWLEEALTGFADVVEASVPGGPWRGQPGAGAAGGLGFALMAFCGADIRNGAAVVGDIVGFERSLPEAEVVVTGEGKLDRQTGWGKTPGYVADRGREVGSRVFAIAGAIEDGAEQAFDVALDLGPEGMDRPAELVRERAAELARLV
jgi:glycerate 2-kinase